MLTVGPIDVVIMAPVRIIKNVLLQAIKLWNAVVEPKTSLE